MSAVPVMQDRDRLAMFRTLEQNIRRRYSALVVAAATPAEKAEIARLGVKLVELTALADQDEVSSRDAVVAPLLAAWLVGRLDTLEQHGTRQPLAFFRSAKDRGVSVSSIPA